jgi:hypothetical protein
MIHRKIFTFGQPFLHLPSSRTYYGKKNKLMDNKVACRVAFVAWRHYCCFELY